MFLEMDTVVERFFDLNFATSHTSQNVMWIRDFKTFPPIEGSCFEREVFTSFLYATNAVSIL